MKRTAILAANRRRLTAGLLSAACWCGTVLAQTPPSKLAPLPPLLAPKSPPTTLPKDPSIAVDETAVSLADITDEERVTTDDTDPAKQPVVFPSTQPPAAKRAGNDRWVAAPKRVELPKSPVPSVKDLPPTLPPATVKSAPPVEKFPEMETLESAPVAAAPTVPFEYRTLAEVAERSPNVVPLTPNTPIIDLPMEPNPSTEVPEPVVLDGGEFSRPTQYYSDADEHTLFWSNGLHYIVLPGTLLWEPPLANQREPRMYAKFTNARNESTIDTAIGGQFGLGRWAPADRPHEGIQLDLFAVAFTRFNDERLLTAADYRAGVPLTYAKGNWQAKISYEHTSTHLGDEFIARTGRQQVAHVRDEIVLGLARRYWDQLRFYGQAGFSFLTSDIVGEDRDRYNAGAEWSRTCRTGLRGQPFAALDFDIRSDQDYNTNTTFQIGWQWRRADYSQGARLALEVYNGRSPYGQFFRDKEDWVGIVGIFDW